MRCCTVTEQAFPGETCPSASVTCRVVHLRHSRWSKSGVWARVFEVLAQDADNEYTMIDSTIVRAHQHSAGAKKGGLTTTRLLDAAVVA